MNTYAVLLRGINVGGKNKVSMADLKQHLEVAGYKDMQTYINSGNVVLSSDKNTSKIKSDIESRLPKWFKLDSDLLKVHVVSSDTIREVVLSKPTHFGEEPTQYHSDVIFLIDIDPDDAFHIFQPNPLVDKVWKGEKVIYSQRLSAERTKSRLNKIMSSPLYKSMTIRNWNTTLKLYEMINDRHVKN